MNKRGFTLIEMITVLVIISLVALISVTAVTKLLNTSKKSLYNNQINQIESAARVWGADHMLILPNDDTSNVVCNYSNIDSCPEDYKKLIITLQDLQDGGYINDEIKDPRDSDKTIDATIEIEKKGRKTNYKVIVNSSSKYKEIILNGADPVLSSDMIPVTIENNGTVRKADTSTEWYKYAEKKWANAVVLNTNNSIDVGETIPETSIKAYYVWIPRYKYQLFNSTTPMEIQITFESNSTPKSTSTTVGQYLTHPAFTYGTDEIKGFWVGKFETTGTSSAPTIKPNIASLRSQNVSSQYATSITLSNNSRMMKNDEWGAVAYLSHSAYGINGEVRINNNKDYITGCGASEADKEQSSSCEITYGKSSAYAQSTTGNITGVFDMSGGAWEYMMAVRADSSGNPLSGRHNLYNSGFNGKFGCPACDSGVDSSVLELTNGTNFPDSKNYNLYDNPSNRDNITADNGCNGNKCYGHALTETKNWNGDYYYFSTLTNSWVFRGGGYDSGDEAGVFNAHGNSGRANGITSFRAVVPVS